MREKLFSPSVRKLTRRITPAYAGKTYEPDPHESHPEDHPRVCGKNQEVTTEHLQSIGSPPRMREKHFVLLSSGSWHRITPAYAGKTKEKY